MKPEKTSPMRQTQPPSGEASQQDILFNTGRYAETESRAHSLLEHYPNSGFIWNILGISLHMQSIVADQETQARRMIDFCGLEWSDAFIDFHKHKRAVNTASLMQVRQPIYKTSVERWRPYEKYLGPLLDALGDLTPKRN